MDQLSQEITGVKDARRYGTNYVNADTQVKQVYDEAVDKASKHLINRLGKT